MLSLADLRTRNVEPTWQEAVAVVQELLHALTMLGTFDRVPDISHVALIQNGDVVILPGSPSVAEPVRHVAAILASLLEGSSSPPELTALVTGAAAPSSQFAALGDFMKALSFFERPGRRNDIERLVVRAMAADTRASTEEELRRLQNRASSADRAQGPDARAQKHHGAMPRRLPLAMGVAVLVLAAAGGAYLQMQKQRKERLAAADGKAATTHPATPTPPERALPAPAAGTTEVAAEGTAAAAQPATERAPAPGTRSFLGRWAAAIRSAVGSVFANDRPAEANASATPASAASEKPKARHSTRPTPPAAEPKPLPQVAQLRPLNMAGSPATTKGAALQDPAIYTSADVGVMPPTMVRPMLPAEMPASVRANQVGFLELLVDEHGDVEQVKLKSPGNRFEEKMIVAHAKTWKFNPATRNGKPVKYRTRVRVTI